MGNMLEAPRDGSWRNSPPLKQEYFQLIKDRGFNSVRLPIRWSDWASRDTPYSVHPSFYAKVDEAIHAALDCGLAVVINIHHYHEIFVEPVTQRERFLEIWKQLSHHYRGYPSVLLFELLNEPNQNLSPNRWNDLLSETIAAVRVENPLRTLIVGPGNWNNIDHLPLLKLPDPEHNTIVTVHYYKPMQFTHQGANWVEGSQGWLGTTWEATPDQQGTIEADLHLAKLWAMQNNRPLFLGEFGAYHNADIDSRARWINCVARTAESKEISWAYWEFCAGFGIYNPDMNEWNQPLVKTLLPRR